MKIDFLVKNCNELITLYGDSPRRGNSMSDLKIIKNGWLGSYRGRIVFIGTEEMFNERNFEIEKEAVIMDAEGKVCMPGLVDAHTHLPFGGERKEEFKMKLDGVPYMELQKKGMGIKSTVKATREVELKELLNISQKRLDNMVKGGATTIEAKSGYGLDFDTEIKQLEVLRILNEIHPVDIVSTYLGGHDIPPDKDKEVYLNELINNYIPEIANKKLAKFFDAFIEEGVYNGEETERMLIAAKKAGFLLKLHADEFTDKGGAALAVKYGALSAEHLVKISKDGIEKMGNSSTAAVILPGVLFFLRGKDKPPVREMIEKGVIVALGSDYNPGSSHINSMFFIMRLSVFTEDFKIEEAITAATINASYAIGLDKETGSLSPGKKTDLLILNIPSYIDIFYEPAINPIEYIIKEGEIILEKCELKY